MNKNTIVDPKCLNVLHYRTVIYIETFQNEALYGKRPFLN